MTASARKKGEEAGSLALARAERAEPGWAARARVFLILWTSSRYRHNAEPWTGEMFRTWAEAKGLTPPPDARSYGPVVREGIREGRITRVGFAPTVSSHGSPRATYRSVPA